MTKYVTYPWNAYPGITSPFPKLTAPSIQYSTDLGADPGFLVRGGGGILKDLLGVQGTDRAPGGCRAKPF
ncbi:hypothetical protein DPMN_146483 [Dreissena polymorpha]|uniref:Uncharacterized protein n=1 Tax=Dreissena polymorpha TaxID=45954 RepID=A0A9D4IYG4_DREPO|nr:hypothetical protein DPMN_146483 [Dreissena polymorpha]